MCTLAALVAVTALAAGCRAPAMPPPEAPSPAPQDGAPSAPRSARFDCDGEIVPVVFARGEAVVSLADRDLTLPRVESGSGARYSDGQSTFWSKGAEATFDRQGAVRTCRELRDPWQEARARGIDVRAVGQEPGWLLEIDDERSIRLVMDYGAREVTGPVPAPATRDGVTTYTADDSGRRLTIVIEPRRCQDVMSGEPSPSTVVVTIDGRELRGCGRVLRPGAPGPRAGDPVLRR